MVKNGYKMTEIGEIPEEWQCFELGSKKSIKKAKAGGTPLRSVKEFYQNGTIPFVKIEDMVNSSKYISKTLELITMEGIKRSSSWIVPADSILFSMYASYGEVSINKVPVATNQAIISIIPNNENVFLEFLYYQLKNMKTYLKQFLRSTTQNNLNADIVKKLIIALPPLPEQQKIAEILSTIDQAIQKTNEIIAKTKQLKKGLMQELLTKGIGHKEFKDTDIGRILKDWEVVRLGDICVKIKAGGTPLTSKNEYYNGNIPFVKIEDLTAAHKYLRSTLTTITEVGLRNSNTWLVPTRSLLVAMYGSIGSMAINEIEVATNQAILGMVPNKEKTNVEFLYYLLIYLKPYFERHAKQTTQPNLTAEIIKNFKTVLPEYQEQQKIAEILFTVDEKIKLLKFKRDETEKLKKGLMNLLLTGKVRVNVY